MSHFIKVLVNWSRQTTFPSILQTSYKLGSFPPSKLWWDTLNLDHEEDNFSTSVRVDTETGSENFRDAKLGNVISSVCLKPSQKKEKKNKTNLQAHENKGKYSGI